MNKKILIPLILFCLLLAGGVAYLYMNLDKQKKVNQEMQELAALDKQDGKGLRKFDGRRCRHQ